MYHFAVTEMAEGVVVDIDGGTESRWKAAPLVDAGDVELGPQIDENVATIRQAATHAASGGRFPVFLGGDHFVTYPLASGVRESRAARFGYLHIDMHLDLADTVPGYGTYASGTPVRRLLEDRVIAPVSCAIIGVESFQHKNEWSYAQEHQIDVTSAKRLRREGIEQVLNRLGTKLTTGTEGVYLSLDIDVLNRTFAPGTGNAVGTEGLLPDELMEVLHHVRQWPLVAMDLVETSPPLDPSGRTAGMAASAILSVLHERLFEDIG